MKFRNLLIIAPLLLILALLLGCEAEDPGAPLPNKLPDTRIVVAPLEGTEYDHYVSPTKLFNIQWFGSDTDGIIAGYYVQIDNGLAVWTTSTDSAIAFEASEPDSNDASRLLENHTIRITAVDDLGDSDPTPAIRTFWAVNYMPEVSKFTADFEEGDTVGRGVYFEIEWADQNISDALVRLNIDGSPVTNWDSRLKFQFCETALGTIVESIDTINVYPVDISLLRAGKRSISIEVKDLGGAISNAFVRNVFVAEGVLPKVTAFTASYGGTDFFPDGSIFYDDNITTVMSIQATAEDYFGIIQAYRYRMRYRAIGDTAAWIDWPDWSDETWSGSTIEFTNLNLGEYQFQVQCRDYTGALSEIYENKLAIVTPDLGGMTILIVDETAAGNDRPGSPADSTNDKFWARITADLPDDGWTLSSVDIDSVGRISPLHVYNKNIIIWHAGDYSSILLSENLGILEQYLEAGGKLIISGWSSLKAFAADPASLDLTFEADFAADYLRITEGHKNPDKEFAGIYGNSEFGCPDLTIDPEKLPSRWNGLMNNCWIMTPGWRSEAICTWKGPADPVSSFEGKTCAVRNYSPVYPWRTMILGFELFFAYEDQAKEFIEWAVTDISQ
ncbi:hypothetical protein K9N50_02140 [bacterium]|nr:hypothetical protein [bacterium]